MGVPLSAMPGPQKRLFIFSPRYRVPSRERIHIIGMAAKAASVAVSNTVMATMPA